MTLALALCFFGAQACNNGGGGGGSSSSSSAPCDAPTVTVNGNWDVEEYTSNATSVCAGEIGDYNYETYVAVQNGSDVSYG